jgi:hypothetical protein
LLSSLKTVKRVSIPEEIVKKKTIRKLENSLTAIKLKKADFLGL